MATHGLLLRLFLSPEFFTVHTALRYLTIYPDNVGITYYLTRRLKELDTQELTDVWGFISHLLVTRPTKSRAVESFVVDIIKRSTHLAMITLWFMQAALRDLSSSPNRSQSFIICQRVLHKCHEIIFADLPPPAPAPYSALSLPFQSRFSRKKVKPHFEPAVIGISMILAGTPGMPQLTEIMGQVAVEQGRVEEEGTQLKSVEAQDEEVASYGSPTSSRLSLDEDADDMDELEENQPRRNFNHSSPALVRLPGSTGSTNLGRRRTVEAAQTAPALPLHLQHFRRSTQSDDPLGQLDAESIATPYQSTPSISSARPQPRSASMSMADALLGSYDMPSQVHLLRSQYCRSEIQFLLTLENISNRLLVVPKPARVSALRAELTALNHKLPAEVCMPMWCSSSDTPRPHGVPQPHHRIVRIPPSESVVLNSAERAPYMLLIEILNDELDFDPAKRGNKEVLKKIVLKENERKGASADLIPFNPAAGRPAKAEYVADTDLVSEPQNGLKSTVVIETPPTPTSGTPPSEEEEMDLVEQLYGAAQSLRSQPINLSDSIVLPPTPKNRDLDMAAWSRSVPPSPTAVENGHAMSLSRSTSQGMGMPSPDPSRELASVSLDEYSERMRTAAIMLAQLNANLAQHSMGIPGIPAGLPDVSVPLRWLPGSSWLTRGGDQNATDGQTNGRLRLQYSEAAGIRDRIMKEMMDLEEERMERMKENREDRGMIRIGDLGGGMNTAEDEGIIRRELNKADPSAIVFSESWAAKKSRVRQGSPYGHLVNWDCVSVIVKTGADLRQEQLATQLIREFKRIWEEENCACWVRYFRILITGASSGLVETITDAVSIHSIKKEGICPATYGDPSSAKFARAQRNFATSLAGYSVVTYLLQIKDRHNGNILLDREGRLVHIDFGFMLAQSPGNLGFEAAPFKLLPEYVEVLGGIEGPAYLEFRRLFREGFEAARKHCDRIITLVELMQKDSTLPCFAAFGEQTASHLRDRLQPAMTHSLVGEYVDRLIDNSLGSSWTRLYDSYQYYSQSIL
ncbi:Phosphatidylinositol 4-kinase [Mycena sanguinolenta]|uniref:1-phosphatidylinositol 4-kinase n=1 Tax=Mycena sanguinolenta TaxID=230812 RepID=A0A8H7D9B1_9AGAR|nr:Phosphatidylinositol 4-kinase [Mycena sanguinolenta]